MKENDNMTTISDPSIMPPRPSVKLKRRPADGQVTCPNCDCVFNVRGFGRHKQACCYIWIRLDPDVPREERKTKSGGQLLTVHTRTRAGKTSTRTEETRDGWSQARASERSKEPQTETRGESSNISSEVLEYKYTKYIY